MDLFVYGTLLDDDVRRAVLGAVAQRSLLVPARLAGWRRVYLRGRHYPVIVPHKDSVVAGALLLDLAASSVSRLSRFEGPEYRLAGLTVVADDGSVAAKGFIGSGKTPHTEVPWELDEWIKSHKRKLLLSRYGEGF